jgi:hypothetical protein
MNEVFSSRKLYNGYVSVPSCIVEYAKRNHKNLRVEYGGQYMIVTPKTPYEVTAPPQQARRTDKYIKKDEYYNLWDYQWLPIEEVKEAEFTNEGRMALLNAWKNLKKPKQLELDNSI